MNKKTRLAQCFVTLLLAGSISADANDVPVALWNPTAHGNVVESVRYLEATEDFSAMLSRVESPDFLLDAGRVENVLKTILPEPSPLRSLREFLITENFDPLNLITDKANERLRVVLKTGLVYVWGNFNSRSRRPCEIVSVSLKDTKHASLIIQTLKTFIEFQMLPVRPILFVFTPENTHSAIEEILALKKTVSFSVRSHTVLSNAFADGPFVNFMGEVSLSVLLENKNRFNAKNDALAILVDHFTSSIEAAVEKTESDIKNPYLRTRFLPWNCHNGLLRARCQTEIKAVSRSDALLAKTLNEWTQTLTKVYEREPKSTKNTIRLSFPKTDFSASAGYQKKFDRLITAWKASRLQNDNRISAAYIFDKRAQRTSLKSIPTMGLALDKNAPSTSLSEFVRMLFVLSGINSPVINLAPLENTHTQTH